MKKYLCLLFVTLFVFAGCGETGKKVATGIVAVGALGFMAADAWYSKYFDDYVRENGVPTSQYTDSSGNTTYAYVRNCPNNQGQEETNVLVDKGNKILSVKQIRTCN